MQGTGILEACVEGGLVGSNVNPIPTQTYIMSELRQSQLFPIIQNTETPYIEYLHPNFVTHSGYLMVKGYGVSVFCIIGNSCDCLSSDIM